MPESDVVAPNRCASQSISRQSIVNRPSGAGRSSWKPDLFIMWWLIYAHNAKSESQGVVPGSSLHMNLSEILRLKPFNFS